MRAAWRAAGQRGEVEYGRWRERLAQAGAERRERFGAWINGELPAGWRDALSAGKWRLAEAQTAEPTRKSSKSVMEVLVQQYERSK